ncbi:hypothetical protein BJX99DRAFT_195658 [Aspergillus californicus]
MLCDANILTGYQSTIHYHYLYERRRLILYHLPLPSPVLVYFPAFPASPAPCLWLRSAQRFPNIGLSSSRPEDKAAPDQSARRHVRRLSLSSTVEIILTVGNW